MGSKTLKPLVETHPDLERHMVDRDLGKIKGKGCDDPVEWKCPSRICKRTHFMRIPDKIRRGNKCKFCRPRKINLGVDYIQKTIQKRLASVVKQAGYDHCTGCGGVFGKDGMAKGTTRTCLACAYQRHAEYIKTHPEYVRVRNANRAKRCRNTKGKFSQKEWEARVDYYGGKCIYCDSTESITVEHRIPISRGGTNWPANLVPACRTCNSRKGTKTEFEFKALLSKEN